MVQIYGPIGVKCSTCGLGTHPPPHVSPAPKPEAPGQFGCPTALTKSQCPMIQVQMNLQDPDSPSLQAHLGCETPTLGQARAREAREQESWARAFLGSVGVCEAGSLWASLLMLPKPASRLPGGARRPHRVPDGREEAKAWMSDSA